MPPREHVADGDPGRAELGGQVPREPCARRGDGDDRGWLPVGEVGAQLRLGRRGPARQPEVERLEVLRGRAPVVDIARGLPVGRGLDEVAPPPIIEPGTPVSACQRMPNLRSGISSTWSARASRSRAKAACQPAGSGLTSVTGTGRGIRGRMASTATVVASSPISRGRPTRTPSRRARSRAKASRAPAAPSARMDEPVWEQIGQ